MSILFGVPGKPWVPWSGAAVKGGRSLDRGEHRGRLGGGGEPRTMKLYNVFGDRASRAAACVSGRRAVRLICAGWLPQDGLFGWSAPLV